MKNMHVVNDFFIDYLLPLTLPVFLETEGQFDFYGSGFLLNLDESFFFISAAHVLEQVHQKRIYLFIENEFVLINGFFCTIAPNKDGKDRIDFGILIISKDLKQKFREAPFLEHDDIDWNGDIMEGNEYYILGYPFTKNKYAIDKISKTIVATPFFAVCWKSNLEVYKKLEISKLTTVALKFDKKKTISFDGTQKTAPNLNGLSGSPVWGISDKEKLLVAGVLIEHHQNSIKSILVTKINPFKHVFGMLINYERSMS